MKSCRAIRQKHRCVPTTDRPVDRAYLSKPFQEQYAVEETRFKTKMLIEAALVGRGMILLGTIN
jgi:hypothetical protein